MVLAHGSVAVVLSTAVVAPDNVGAQPQRPDRHESGHEDGSGRGSKADTAGDERDDQESRAPIAVDDAGVAQQETDEPQRDHDRQGCPRCRGQHVTQERN